MDGEAALSVLEKVKIDLVVSDVIMPHMDGYELARNMRKLYPNIKIQLVSGFADDRQSGVEDNELHEHILYKPYTSQTLLMRVRELLDENREHSPVKRRILVLDDEPDMLELYKLNLSKLGYSIITELDGNEAILEYRKALDEDKPIDAVIVDIALSGDLSGVDVAKKIQGMDNKAKIIVASGNTLGPEMTNFKHYGFNAALEKNFARNKMKDVLEGIFV